MPAVTLQVIEGVDKGRIFREVPTPITIGREEGNLVRLNDERISRYHSKIQFDNDEVVITDLESTNGTRINGNTIQIRRLMVGDRIEVGRSMLLFGSEEEINARIAAEGQTTPEGEGNHTIPTSDLTSAATLGSAMSANMDFLLDPNQPITEKHGQLFYGQRPLPPLPLKMSPSQAARTAELLDFLHQQITLATENIKTDEATNEVKLSFVEWQRILALHAVLSRYVRAVAEPDLLQE